MNTRHAESPFPLGSRFRSPAARSDRQRTLNKAGVWAGLILPVITLPTAILAPFFWLKRNFTDVNGMLQIATYFDVTVLLPVLLVLAVALLWPPLLRRATYRGPIFVVQLLAMLFVSAPTMLLYGGLREAGLQAEQREFLFAAGAAPGGLPTFGSYSHLSISSGLHPGLMLVLWLAFLALPAYGCYRHYLSPGRLAGIKPTKLFT